MGLLFPVFLAATLAFLPVWLLLGLLGLHFGGHRRTRRSAYWGMFYSLGGMLLCAGSIRTYYPLNLPAEAPEDALTVLSYNIQTIYNPDKLAPSELPVIQYLLNSEADIVCVQEAGKLSQPEYDTLLATSFPFRQYNSFHGGSYACLSRLPIVGGDTLNIISKSNGAVYYELLMGTDTLMLVNCHLESYKLQATDRQEYKELITNPDSSNMHNYLGPLTQKLSDANVIRSVQADSLAAFIENCSHRYILLCGDFNDAPISYTHYRLTRKLNDVYTRSGNGPGFSYNQSDMYFRIDHILCSSSFCPYEAKVDASIKASDHYPIRCRLIPAIP